MRAYFCSGFETWPRKRGTPCLSVIATILGWSKVTGIGEGRVLLLCFCSVIAVAAAASAPSSSTYNKMERTTHGRGLAILGITLIFRILVLTYVMMKPRTKAPVEADATLIRS